MSLRVNGTIDSGPLSITIDLTVERGETVALVGPNGAGKSTVLHCVAGLRPLRAGSVSLDGVAWDDTSSSRFVPPEQRSVGVVFQEYRLFEHLTARDNVAFGLRARGASRAESRRVAAELLQRLDISGSAEQHPSTLSGGQAQRVAIARAVATNPDVMLLDEPLAALDVSARGVMRRHLAEVIGTVDACRIIVTHDPVDAHALADRVVVLEAGAVTHKGTLAELAATPRSAYVAELMGTNLVRGQLRDGRIDVDGGGVLYVGAHEAPDGAVIATIRPAAVALHRSEPHGSPRNVWRGTISSIDSSDGRVRVRLGGQLPLTVEVTAGGLAALQVDAGGEVWASVKASEIAVVADA